MLRTFITFNIEFCDSIFEKFFSFPGLINFTLEIFYKYERNICLTELDKTLFSIILWFSIMLSCLFKILCCTDNQNLTSKERKMSFSVHCELLGVQYILKVLNLNLKSLQFYTAVQIHRENGSYKQQYVLLR